MLVKTLRCMLEETMNTNHQESKTENISGSTINGQSTNPQKIVIIGSGIAGLSAAKAAREQDPLAEITILSQESDPPFYRLRLCELIGKQTPYENLYIHPSAWYTERKITLLLSHRVLSIDDAAKFVITDNGKFSFDSLIISSGSVSFMPPFIGKDLPGIHTLWDIRDLPAINSALQECRHAVVIGGGLLGLETAYCISRMAIPTAMVEGMPRLLPKQLDEEGSALIKKKAESYGISVTTGQSVKEFRGDGRVEEVVLADGQVLEADFVAVLVGVRPNTGICTGSRIFVDRYIPVDDKMHVTILSGNSPADGVSLNPADSRISSKISDSIYAAGDVSSFENKWFGQWSVATLQGQIAGTNAAGGDALYSMENSPYVLNTMETRVVVSGEGIISEGEDIEILADTVQDTCSYMKLVFRKGILVGGILIGNYSSRFVNLQSLIKSQATKESILLSDFFPRR